MSFDKLAEDRIRAAIDAGSFDDLPGKGKPLNLDEYFAVAEDWRMGVSLLKSSGFLPQEMQLLKDAADLAARLPDIHDASKRRRIEEQIREKNLQYALLVERRQAGRNRGQHG